MPLSPRLRVNQVVWTNVLVKGPIFLPLSGSVLCFHFHIGVFASVFRNVPIPFPCEQFSTPAIMASFEENCFAFCGHCSLVSFVPSLWNVDGEVTVPEQKPGEVAEELASSYERKLIEVAEMHGELIEFNERLHRALVAKEALVSQMRQELIDLRGP
ncbi:hypothetical protein STEG23_004054, partial [Scotinomys teguina]